MTRVEAVASFAFNPAYRRRKQGRVNFHLRAADMTNDMVMGFPGQFISQMTVAPIRHLQDIVGRQEIQRSIDGGLRHAGLADAFVNSHRGEVPAIVEGLQDGKPLGGDAETTFAQYLGESGNARHEDFLIDNFINKEGLVQWGKAASDDRQGFYNSSPSCATATIQD